MIARNQPYTAILFKFGVLVGLLYMPVLLFHLGTWFPFAGASGYLLWELGRLHRAFGDHTGPGNEQRSEQRREPTTSAR
ncbi:hypothetical protein OG889_21060 [Streptomyces sp. NBC_00481]|uniref:hypothetical protein n=1 Tax=unclassified Streptomyces TaxID=2593676 RepID=UPI002DDB9C5E|nr:MULTISPECIES: hypothetical protein [unclassified Streptomyces]WRY97007.1 hypothetical protein OG889_21060 [Streptomyces sp. NBC_00481]